MISMYFVKTLADQTLQKARRFCYILISTHLLSFDFEKDGLMLHLHRLLTLLEMVLRPSGNAEQVADRAAGQVTSSVSVYLPVPRG
jgi:hypothetical protein